MSSIEFIPGKRYSYQQHPVRLLRQVDLRYCIGEYEATGALVNIPVSQLRPISAEADSVVPLEDDILWITNEAWDKAQRKYAAIRPILADRRNRRLLTQVAEAQQVTVSTIYRWLQAYERTNSVRSLVEIPNTGGKGQDRLDPEVDTIIEQAIQSQYLTTQKKPITKVILEIQQQCRQANKTAPGVNTVRRRIRRLSEEEKVRLRWSKKMAKEQFEPIKGSFPDADYPLAVVQIDHTPVDLILVDEVYRKPLGRPFLTVATDVFSRMVVGFYLSFDPVGTIAVGMCIANAILPKETWLSRIDVQGEWPCWGAPTVLHMDNAKEFRGSMLERVCQKYKTRLEFRPVGTPHWGGHVERIIKTFMDEVHTLPGTTFSNTKDRKDYNSEKKAVFTLPEFERWLTHFIINVYHKRIHQSLRTSPYERYQEGIIGSLTQLGTGLPERHYDEIQVRLDFMPGEERTIQEYGVVMDYIYYYGDVLKPYINSLELVAGKRPPKRKFTFKRDPRDISYLYFLDPTTKQYHRISYRNTSHPAISIWEFRQALELAKQKGKEKIDEDAIFEAYEEMRKMELASTEQTRRMNKTSNRLTQALPATTVSAILAARSTEEPPAFPIHPISSASAPPATGSKAPKQQLVIRPFDDLHDDALSC